MNEAQVRNSTKALGRPTVEMLFQVHKDALWMLENMGVGCKHPQIQQAYRQYETTGEAVFYENRIYPAATLVERCLQRIPTIDAFHIPRNSFLIGGTAPYIYDDKREK